MPDPKDKAAVQRFLGMVVHVEKFIPNMSEVTKPLGLRALFPTYCSKVVVWKEGVDTFYPPPHPSPAFQVTAGDEHRAVESGGRVELSTGGECTRTVKLSRVVLQLRSPCASTELDPGAHRPCPWQYPN